MMNLKQHNNIVQKLIQQIQSKDKQLTQLNKQLTQQTKTINNQSNKTIQSTQTDKLINKKITQLNKQHQSKLSTINQQLKTLTQQNLQLKQRLNLKTQIQYKQKQRIAQILKKSVVQRKPGSKQDYKISALISHYQEQINKKNIYIQTLKRQIKSSVINNKQELKSINNNNNINNNINNNNNNNNNNSISPSISTKSTKLQESDKNNDQDQGDVLQKRSVSLVEHKKVVQKLNKQIQTVNDILENRNIQLQQLKNNYNQLTKQYYRVVNQYGVAKQFTQTNIKSKQSKNINNNNNNNNRNNTNNTNNNINNNINNNQNIKNTNNTNNKQSNLLSNAMIMMKNNTTSFNKLKQPSFIQTNKSQTNFSFDLSQDITNNYINNDQNQQEDVSISLTFEENFKNFNHRPKLNLEQQQEPQDDHNQNHQPKRNTQKQQRLTKNNQNNLELQQINKQLKQLQSLISSILQIFNLSNKQEILPCLNDLAAKTTFLQVNQHILSNLHQFLYKFGMGKVSKNQMIQVLNKFQNNCNKWIQANDLLDEICIQIGAKRHKLIQKVNLYKQMQQDYLTKMKAASFLTELNKSQKLLEFIDFFQLDKSNLQLPQQLKNIYQQLKYVDRFIKLANSTLGIQIRDRNGLEQTLQLILKKLEKYYSWEIEIQKENQKRINKKKQKLKENTQQ